MAPDTHAPTAADRHALTLAALRHRVQQKRFWLVLVISVALVLGIQAWRPFPVTWDSGMALHHLTLFSLLYLAARWRYPAHLAFSAALGISVLPLVFTGAPLGQYSLALWGEFSLLTSFALIWVALFDYRWRRALTPLFPGWFWLLGGMLSLVAVTGQWISMDLFPYFHAENTAWLARFVIVLCLLLCLHGHFWAVPVVAAVAIGYEWRLLDSHNAFDYAGDLFWLLALPVVLIQRWRSRNPDLHQ